MPAILPKLVIAFSFLAGLSLAGGPNLRAETLKLEMLGVSFELPTGSGWKASIKPYFGGHIKIDELEGVSSRGFPLKIQLRRSEGYETCTERAKMIESRPFKAHSGIDRLPSGWFQTLYVRDKATVACLDTARGVIRAYIRPVELTREDATNVKQVLEHFTAAFLSNQLPAAATLTLKVLGISFREPKDSTWKVGTTEIGPDGLPQKGGQSFDTLTRTFPLEPRVFMVLMRNSLSAPCSTAIDSAPQLGPIRAHTEGWVAGGWNPLVLQRADKGRVSVIACYDKSIGTVSAYIAIDTPPKELKESDITSVRNLLGAATPALQGIQ